MENLKEISLSNLEKKGDAKAFSYNLMNEEAKKIQEQIKLNQSKARSSFIYRLFRIQFELSI
jgi:hypothetical protein